MHIINNNICKSKQTTIRLMASCLSALSKCSSHAFSLTLRLNRLLGTIPACCPLAPVVPWWGASDPCGRCAPQRATHWACLPTWESDPTGPSPFSDTPACPTPPIPEKTAPPNPAPRPQARWPPVLRACARLPSGRLSIRRPGLHRTRPR